MTNDEMVVQYNLFCAKHNLEAQGSISRNQVPSQVLGDILSALHAKSRRLGIKQGYDEGYSYGYSVAEENAAHEETDGI